MRMKVCCLQLMLKQRAQCHIGYTAPTLTRRIQREEDGQKYQQRRIAKEKRHEKEAELKMPEDALGTRAVFA